jgi:deoxyribodipyrimidine photo-lyase
MNVIHWFRRDLRLCDNTALCAAAKAGRVIPSYILPPWRDGHRWTSPARRAFLRECLVSLSEDLAKQGGQLILREGNAKEELARLLDETKAEAIYFNRDPDPFGRQMESKVEALARSKGVAVFSFKDVAIHEREEILTNAGEHYRVFTPYANAWRKVPKFLGGISRKMRYEFFTAQLPSAAMPQWLAPNPSFLPPAGERAARNRFRSFLSGPIFEYGQKRDIPAGTTTSRLSADLRFGTISVRQIYAECQELAGSADMEGRKSIGTFVNELIWREFYMQVLWRWPEVLHEEFNPKFRSMKWRYPEGSDRERFERWRNGETGFPIVDAAMRQLNATGFMHNRLRMIVAMFLTKDLHLDWRLGELYFMQRLIDGDIAANNGGWQWSAGCGADAAPYFRIQNPWTQAARFDPEGEFVRQWIPELAGVPAAKFLSPPADGLSLARGYPLPMLDHAQERLAALEMVGL